MPQLALLPARMVPATVSLIAGLARVGHRLGQLESGAQIALSLGILTLGLLTVGAWALARRLVQNRRARLRVEPVSQAFDEAVAATNALLQSAARPQRARSVPDSAAPRAGEMHTPNRC